MSRKRIEQPKYGYHISGQARVTLDNRTIYLGEYDSPESKAKYYAILSIYKANGNRLPDDIDDRQANMPITVRCITSEFRERELSQRDARDAHCQQLKNLCTLLEDNHGDEPASEFGPRKLAVLRELMVTGGHNCRRYINEQIGNIVRIFDHGLSLELVTPDRIVALRSLKPLKRGQAKDNPPPAEVSLETIKATLPELTPTLVAMVRIQVATAMRPSELFRMRPGDIDRSGEVWFYRPESHKSSHHGKFKAIPIMGSAREALTPFLFGDCVCFTNSRGNPWNKDSYRQAIDRAAKRAKVQHWTPYDIRRTSLQGVSDEGSLDLAAALGGHSSKKITERHYARRNERQAIEAAKVAPRLGGLH